MKSGYALLAALTLGMATPALAHGLLENADPAEGEVLIEAPEAVILEFSEDLELALSEVVVTDEAGARIETGPVGNGGAANVLRVELPVLAPGTYTVDWTVTSVDTHATDGRYSFTLN